MIFVSLSIEKTISRTYFEQIVDMGFYDVTILLPDDLKTNL